jgi:hypothetical protein
MRFAVLLSLAAAASAAVLEHRQTGGIIVCACPTDRLGFSGTKISQEETTYTCAYGADGSCTWTQVCFHSYTLCG